MDAPSPPPDRKHVFDDPANVRKLLRIFFTCCAVLLPIELVLVVWLHAEFPWVREAHAMTPWDRWFAFYPIYGMVACIVLVLLAKFVLRPLVMRREDDYGDG